MDEVKRGGRVRPAMWAACLMIVAGLGGAAEAGQYSGLVVFGDSLSDTGNTYAAARFPPSSQHYYEGRYSDGPN